MQKYIYAVVLIFCFASQNLAEAAKSVDAKILPITSNTYRKDPTELKKAVKTKKTNDSKTTTSSTVKNNTFSSKSSSASELEKGKSIKEAPKVISSSSIKVNQPQNSVPPKKLNEEKTSKKDRIPEPIIKVKLGTSNHSNVKVVFPDGGQVANSKGKKIKSIKKGDSFTWSSTAQIDNKNKNKNKKKKKIEYLNETLILIPSKNIFVFNNTEYRGKLKINFTEKGAVVVNELPMEEYLRGVVGREIGASSPNESLKAQSVIARTYAYAHKGRHGSDGADVCNTTHCQVYFGKSAERDAVDKAIKDTRGYILTYNGNPISALYHATCGGMTSNNEDVWGGSPEPFLRRVICNFCVNGTKYRWNKELTANEIRNGLAKEGIKLGEILGVSIEAPAKMDRVSNIVFKTSSGEEKVRGTTFRRIFDLPTTTFVLGDIKEKDYIIASARENYSEDSFYRRNMLINSPNVTICGFSSNQFSPKQLLVYTSGGLKRAQLPLEGWKCISYKEIEKSIALSEKNEDNKKKGVNSKDKNKAVSSKNSSKKTLLKPVTKINLFGRGFGHQVGLCQSGAVEMGKINWNFRQILAHYYKGVALKKLGY